MDLASTVVTAPRNSMDFTSALFFFKLSYMLSLVRGWDGSVCLFFMQRVRRSGASSVLRVNRQLNPRWDSGALKTEIQNSAYFHHPSKKKGRPT